MSRKQKVEGRKQRYDSNSSFWGDATKNLRKIASSQDPSLRSGWRIVHFFNYNLMKRIVPYKDRYSRGTILAFGLVILWLLNGLFYIILKQADYILPYIVLMCLLWLYYWMKRTDFSRLVYKVDEQEIQIWKWSKVIQSISRDDILEIEHGLSLPRHRWWWVRSSGNTFHARLANTQLTKITTRGYGEVWLSGKVS